MYRQQQEQLEQIAQWLEREKAHVTGPEMYDRLMERIHREFYIENALWNADIDQIEFMVRRFLDQS